MYSIVIYVCLCKRYEDIIYINISYSGVVNISSTTAHVKARTECLPFELITSLAWHNIFLCDPFRHFDMPRGIYGSLVTAR
jgi:hypothetical protein